MKIFKIALLLSTLIYLPATYAENNCIYLYVHYDSNHYKLDKVSCAHGGFVIPRPGVITMEQAAFYGPDCTIKATSIQKPTQFVTFEAQQNYCFLEAGAITVKQLSQNPSSLRMHYTSQEGSYGGNHGDGSPGDISFGGFSISN